MDETTRERAPNETGILESVSSETLARTLPWFRVLFGVIGILRPRLLGRWYGIVSTQNGSNEVALRYACIRGVGLGLGQLTAPPERRNDWKRVGILVDALDTIMVVHAGLRGNVSKKSAVVMLSGTVFGTIVGVVSALRADADR